MNDLAIYLLKSTICITSLYMVFRATMRREVSFNLNRWLLIGTILFSALLPLLALPHFLQAELPVRLTPVFSKTATVSEQMMSASAGNRVINLAETVVYPADQHANHFEWTHLIAAIWWGGVLGSIILLLRGLFSVLLLFRKASERQINGFRVMIVEQEIPAFSCCGIIFLSRPDFEQHRAMILPHEQVHIRLGHFYDLILLETVKIFHWFNPFIYWLIRDLKEIHEYQADHYTLNKGIDATQYQLLIIQKSVGLQRFALANSFNHCRIKKRIAMMNKQRLSTAASWKVATFLPLLALLLLAFGRKGENVPPENFSSPKMELQKDSVRQWNEADFKSGNLKIEDPLLMGRGDITVLMNAKSQLLVDNQKMELTSLPDYIRKFFDYELANDLSRKNFVKKQINEKEQYGPTSFFIILKDIATDPQDYQQLLGAIGNTILEVREKYAVAIFGSSYEKLSDSQKQTIDQFIPMNVYIVTPKVMNKPTAQ